ncbi:hypothetical protein CR513_33191, partial [Mucuna pruriens]
MQVGQLADIVSQMQSTGSRNIPSVPLPFPTRAVPARRSETDEDLLKLFKKVEINILLLEAIKQVPKYAKFLKELWIHKRKKMKEGVKTRGIMSALIKCEDVTTRVQRVLLKKCQDLGIFAIPCTIGNYTFTDAMLDLGALINVMPTSVYRSLNFGDLEPTRMVIQLANRSVVQPLGVLEVLVQVNELIFPTDFYVLDMEDEASGKGSALVLGQPFLMTARMKIDVYVGTLSMEFGENLVQFNIFEPLKHPAEDHSIFNIDTIDRLVEEHVRMGTGSANLFNFVEISNIINCFYTMEAIANSDSLSHIQNFSNSLDYISDVIDCKCRIDEVPECP